MTSADTHQFNWRIEQGERERLLIPVLDDANNTFLVTGWPVDAVIKTRPGGPVLYTWPPELAHVTEDGAFVELIVPVEVSAAWTWTEGWYRVKIQDPTSDPDDPDVQRIIQGVLLIDQD